jgi:outer membrane biosynthesis protein TonB
MPIFGSMPSRLFSWGASNVSPVRPPNGQPAASPGPYGPDAYQAIPLLPNVPTSLAAPVGSPWGTPNSAGNVAANAASPSNAAQMAQLATLEQQILALQAQVNTLIATYNKAPGTAPGLMAPPPPPPPPPAPPAPPAALPPPPPPPPPPPAPPAPPPAPVAAPAPEQKSEPKTVTVVSGDTLSGIAQRELGNGDRWGEIYELNKDVVGDDPNLILPGQELKMPGADNAPAAQAPSAAPAPAPPPGAAGFGAKVVQDARQLKADGYHYTVNLTSNYNPVRFKVGCCADFVIDSWAKAGNDLHGVISNPHYVPTIMDWMKSHGHFVQPGGRAQPGDMVFFRWSGDNSEGSHTAIVTEVDGNGRASKIIESYDFNQPVRERAVGNSAAEIVGYGHM